MVTKADFTQLCGPEAVSRVSTPHNNPVAWACEHHSPFIVAKTMTKKKEVMGQVAGLELKATVCPPAKRALLPRPAQPLPLSDPTQKSKTRKTMWLLPFLRCQTG